MKFQVEEIVRSLFAYTAGSVYYWEGDVQPDNVVRLSLPTRRLITEGLKRRDELLRFLAALEESSVRLEVVEGGDKDLSGNARLLFGALERDSQFTSACRAAGLDPLSAARTVQMLRLAGAVHVTRDKASDKRKASGGASKAGASTLRELIMLHVNLMTELSSVLVAVDGTDAVRERIASLLRDATPRFPQLLEGIEPGVAGALDPEDLMRRAMRISGDRERHVLGALGEVVTYLEFELRNHPRVDDPEMYLEALEPLRAKLDA